MQAAECSQLRRLLSSDDFNRYRGVAMSITVSIFAVQTHTPDVDTDEMLNNCHSPSLISISGCRPPLLSKAHGCLRSFSLTGTILLISSLFVCIQSSRSQYFISTNHLSCGFYLDICIKSLHAIRPLADWSTAVTSHAAVNNDACSNQISSQNI